ncbi:MAG: AMP-binding protein [Clostridiales bacterium]|jgi:acetyl-CoA synthetase|nr:AMP-binding protein [Clostridiales bacterium]
MAIYQKFTSVGRDDCSSLKELYARYSVSYPENFNFAYDVLDVIAEHTPEKLALLWVGADGAEKYITFGELRRQVNKTANYFASAGIGKGDFVLLVLKRSYLFWYALMALHKLGAVAVQATHLLMRKDYEYRINAAGIKMAVITGDGDCAAELEAALPKCPTLEIRAISTGERAGWLSFEAGVEAASEDFPRVPTLAADTMLVSFSSGTTGYPKMVTHTFAYPLGHIMTGVFWHRVVDGGLHFTISDTGWLKSLWGKMYGQWFGESAVFVYDFDKFNASDILSKIEKYRVSTLCVPPTMYRFMLLEDLSKYDLSSLLHCCTAGEALNSDIFEKWKAAVGLPIYEGFGQSETTVCCGVLYPYSRPVPGSMGLGVPGYDMFVADSSGRPAPPGVSGEICVRNRPAGLHVGYYRNDEATAASFSGGVYHTGDVAYMDESGYFWYVGRNDDIIKSSGYRIGPFEVESVLLEHPAVLEAAVTGVPDPVRGFAVKATIVLKTGFAPGDELKKEIQTFVKKRTAPYKYPRVVEFVSELPKTISGKIRRVEIREGEGKN